tara:strand:+ start:3560 stop:3751 length:192 start_codon:yes stop_codon:yes gene_type:complete
MENTFNMRKYEVVRIFKDGSKQRIVDENLTELEAQKQVQEDIKTNPNCDYYMIIYRTMRIYLN